MTLQNPDERSMFLVAGFPGRNAIHDSRAPLIGYRRPIGREASHNSTSPSASGDVRPLRAWHMYVRTGTTVFPVSTKVR